MRLSKAARGAAFFLFSGNFSEQVIFNGLSQ